MRGVRGTGTAKRNATACAVRGGRHLKLGAILLQQIQQQIVEFLNVRSAVDLGELLQHLESIPIHVIHVVDVGVDAHDEREGLQRANGLGQPAVKEKGRRQETGLK